MEKKTSIGLAILAALGIFGGFAEGGPYGAAQSLCAVLFLGAFVALLKPSLVLPGKPGRLERPGTWVTELPKHMGNSL